jgi:hypothetical protein
MFKTIVKLALLPAAAAILVACGGGGSGGSGGGSSSSSGGSGSQTAFTLSGTGAYGAPVALADVSIFDAKGSAVGVGKTDLNGKFEIELTEKGTAPYLLDMVKDQITLRALHPDASSGTVNITPLSDVVVAMLSPTGTSAGLVESLKSGGTPPTADQIKERREVISESLSGVAQAAGATGDPFNTPFDANGKGHDKLLDSVSISSNAVGGTKEANIQIAVKVSVDPENPTAEMPTINLRSNSTLQQAQAQAAVVGQIKAEDLPVDNAGTLYTEFLANLNACYKDKPEVRTDGADKVLSDACKKIFFNQNSAQYLSHGQKIGKGQAFSGMFTYSGVVEFLPAVKNYLVQDLSGSKSNDKVGRAIVALSWSNSDGNRENISLYVSKYKINGQELLGLSGDKNKYAVAVVSHNQKREFPLRQSTDLDYVQSSYLISARDVFKDGKSVIDFVKVTSPSNRIILMASPKGGASRDLAICTRNEIVFDQQKLPLTPKNEEEETYGKEKPKFVCTGNKSITFAEKFISSTETRKPSDMSVGILRSLDSEGNPYTPTSEDLARFQSVGRWKIDYHFVDDTVISQNTWSVARPMTVEEMLGSDGPDLVMPKYTQETVDKLKNLKNQPGNRLTGCPPSGGSFICDPLQSPVPAPLTGGFEFSWTDSTLPVTSLWVSGQLYTEKNGDGNPVTWIQRFGSTPWDDQRLVLSSARSAVVKCTRQSSLDKHCSENVTENNVEGDYNSLSYMTYSELWAKDSEQRSMMRSFNWFQPRDFNNNPF